MYTEFVMEGRAGLVRWLLSFRFPSLSFFSSEVTMTRINHNAITDNLFRLNMLLYPGYGLVLCLDSWGYCRSLVRLCRPNLVDSCVGVQRAACANTYQTRTTVSRTRLLARAVCPSLILLSFAVDKRSVSLLPDTSTHDLLHRDMRTSQGVLVLAIAVYS